MIDQEIQIDESELEIEEKTKDNVIQMIDFFKFIERETQTDDLVKIFLQFFK